MSTFDEFRREFIEGKQSLDAVADVNERADRSEFGDGAVYGRADRARDLRPPIGVFGPFIELDFNLIFVVVEPDNGAVDAFTSMRQVGWRGGTSPPRSHRSGRDTLASSGSCNTGQRAILVTQRQCS
ncbi:hypothetical protein, partial [Salininema proteolyticum]